MARNSDRKEQRNPVIERAHELRQRGDHEGARQLLSDEVRRHPSNWEANLALWDVARHQGRPERAVEAFERCIHQELRRGEVELALVHWAELGEQLPEHRIGLDLRSRLAEALIGDDRTEDAADLLVDADRDFHPSLPVGVKVRLARAAAHARSTSVPDLRRQIESSLDVPEPIRRELTEALDYAEVQGLRLNAEQTAVIELAEEVPSERRLQVIPAQPQRFDGGRLELEVEGQGPRKMPIERVQAVATAQIDAGDGSYVVIDLLVDALWSDRPVVRTIRLRSDRFDPRSLVPGLEDPLEALLTFVDDLLGMSEATPLPDAEAVRGRPFAHCATLAQYQAEVLGFKS